MNATELFEITTAEWIASLWPIWIVLIGVVIGLITPKSQRPRK